MSIVLGPFRLIAPLGRGGSAEVWRAVHERQDVPVAIKILLDAGLDDPVHRTAEVRALAALDHPNLLMVFDHGEVPECARSIGLSPRSPWIATELCSGGSLAHVGPRNWNQLRRVAQDVLAGLAYAHARGVLHRDLTPDNVLVSASTDIRPGLKLGDFGLSSDHRVAQASTRGRQVAGTPAYMAPEQFAGDLASQGPWTDIYALGCLLWRLCTGDAPFGNSRPPEVLAAAHADLDPPAFRSRFSVPSGFEVLLRALLAKKPGERVQSAAETLSALDAVDGHPIRALPPDWRTGTSRRQAMRLVGAGLGLHPFRAVPIIGRDTERDQLWAALLDVRQRCCARVVRVTGGPGIGKRALVRWLSERAQEAGAARVAEVVRDGSDPYDALADALIHARPTPPADRVSPHGRSLELGGAPPDPRDRDLANHGPTLGAALRALAMEVRARGPVLLHVPDADTRPGLLAAISALLTASPAEAEPAHGLLIVMTGRGSGAQGFGEPAAGDDALGLTIPLGPLSPAHQVHLVEGVLGLGGDIAHRVRERAQGNPAFSVAMVNDLIRHGALVAGEGGFTAPPGTAPELPADLDAIWRQRLDDAVAGIDPRLVQLAALLGPNVPRAVWGQACQELGLGDAGEPWAALGRHALVFPGALGWQWDRHALDAALPPGDRQAPALPTGLSGDPLAPAALHVACAVAWSTLFPELAPDHRRAAHHFALASQPLDAARALQRAAQASAQRDPRATVELIDHRDAALTDGNLAPSDPLWGDGWVLRVRALVELGDWALAEPPAERLLHAAWSHGWTALMGPGLVLRGEIARGQGDLVLAQERLGEALDLCSARGDDRGVARSALALGRLAQHRGRLGEAGRFLQQAQALYTRLGNGLGACACLLHRAEVARCSGNPPLARELLDQARLRQARRAGEGAPDVLGAVLWRLLDADLARDAGQPSAAAYAAALLDAEAIGAASLVARAAIGLGLSGDPTGFDRALREAEAVHDHAVAAVALACRLPSVARADLAGQVRLAGAALARTGCYHPDVAPALAKAASLGTAEAPELKALAAAQQAMVQK